MSAKYSLGFDIGGTFTDAVLHTAERTYRAKSPTTPHDLGDGVIAGIALLAEQVGLDSATLLPDVGRMTLGTTAVTNVLTSENGRRVGLLTTAGFEDELSIAKGRRLNTDGWVSRPPELVKRRHIRGIRERIDRNGSVLVPLDDAEVLEAGRSLIEDDGVEALAISYVWSHLDPEHERRSEKILRDAYPDVPVMAGALLNPVMRGFERMTYAVLNAYTSGAFTGIDRLEGRMADLGLTVPLLVVNCAGGAMTMSAARDLPISLVHSGPAAGVSASAMCAVEHEVSAAVACDMGGTSFDVALITDGAVSRTVRGEIFGTMTSLAHVEVESIGAGGGSIGWVDSRGALRVGPQSAGAVPGPACYGNGGKEPAITDALVVLGYIDPTTFLGGRMTLDRDASVAACARLGEQLGGLSATEVAWGIRSIGLNSMVKATRMAISTKGLDPRSHSIVSYGGCGSLFSADIAQELHVTKVIAPETASVFSAYGAVTAATRRESALSVGQEMPADSDVVREVAELLIEGVARDLEADGVPRDSQELFLEADMRFRQQVADLTIPLRSLTIDKAVLDQLSEDFQAEYTRRYGQGALLMGATIEFVTLRAVGTGAAPVEAVGGSAEPPVQTEARAAGTRSVQIARTGEPDHVPAYVLDDLTPGAVVEGPALIDGSDTTIWVPVGASAQIGTTGSLVVDFA